MSFGGRATIERMRLPACLSLVLIASGCGGSTPPPEPAMDPRPPTLQGTIEQVPYAGRVAIMLPAQKWNSGVTTSTLRVYQRPMSCAAAREDERGPTVLRAGEYMVDVTFPAPWPFQPGMVWESPPEGKGGLETLRIYFITRASNGAHGGPGARGRVRVLEASPTGGLLEIDATGTHGTGSVRGLVPFTLCPG